MTWLLIKIFIKHFWRIQQINMPPPLPPHTPHLYLFPLGKTQPKPSRVKEPGESSLHIFPCLPACCLLLSHFVQQQRQHCSCRMPSWPTTVWPKGGKRERREKSAEAVCGGGVLPSSVAVTRSVSRMNSLPVRLAKYAAAPRIPSLFHPLCPTTYFYIV